MISKTEYPSLLPAGIHDVHIKDLEARFVLPFKDQTQRKNVLGRFLVFHSRLISFGVFFEIWLDGSFTTEKENPNDIDLVIFGDPNQLNLLPDDKQKELQQLLDNGTARIRYSCDTYFAFINDAKQRSYWRGWYGFTRNEQAKGFVRLVY